MSQWWVTSTGLLALLVLWSSMRRDVESREHSKAMLEAILSKTLKNENAISLLSMESVFTSCDCVASRGLCRDMRSASTFLQSMASDVMECFRKITNLLIGLWQWRQCGAVSRFLCDRFLVIAKMIDSNAETWGDLNWHQAPQAVLRGPIRARRYDVELRAQASQSQRRGCKRHLEEVVSSGGVTDQDHGRFMRMDLREYKKVCRDFSSKSKNSAISLAIDGSKFGKPMQEYLMTVFASCTSEHGFVCTPEVQNLGSCIALGG